MFRKYAGKVNIAPNIPPNVPSHEGTLFFMGMTEAYAPFLLGAIATLLERERWEGTEEQVNYVISEIERIIYYFPEECSNIPEGLVAQDFALDEEGVLSYTLLPEEACSTVPEFRLNGDVIEWRPTE